MALCNPDDAKSFPRKAFMAHPESDTPLLVTVEHGWGTGRDVFGLPYTGGQPNCFKVTGQRIWVFEDLLFDTQHEAYLAIHERLQWHINRAEYNLIQLKNEKLRVEDIISSSYRECQDGT